MSERNLEDEFFAKLDAEAKARLRAKLQAEEERFAKDQRRHLHFHKCGKCGADMDTRSFRGIEIEVCPECGAVLLDPGELEELAGTDKTDLMTSFFTMFGAGRKKR